MKILIGINTLTQVEQLIYANHMAFFYNLGKKHPDWVVGLFTPRRMGIDRMRNSAAKMAVEGDFDYLIFIDDDVVIPIDLIDRLIKADKDIIAGWTIIRGFPFDNMYFKMSKRPDGRNDLIPDSNRDREDKVIDVDAVGFSTCVIKVDLLKKVPTPWFVTGPTNTEDIYFCLKAQQYVPGVTICVDKGAETGHIMGPEFISPWNREDYIIYANTQDGSLGKKDIPPFLEESGDRGKEYLEMVKGPLPGREELKPELKFGKLNLPEVPTK